MSSAAQTLANQQNSQHSTGPRTPEGKRQSSTNAIKHGLTSQTVVLPHENAEAYAAFRDDVFHDYQPDGAEERILAQTICDTQWRIERARAMEGNLVQLAHHEEIPAHIAAIQDPAHRLAMIGAHGYDKRHKQIKNLQLQEARLQRTLLNTMDTLRELQNDRHDHRRSTLAFAVQIRQACAKAERVFEPALFGFNFTEAEIDAEQKRRVLHKLTQSSSSAPTKAV